MTPIGIRADMPEKICAGWRGRKLEEIDRKGVMDGGTGVHIVPGEALLKERG